MIFVLDAIEPFPSGTFWHPGREPLRNPYRLSLIEPRSDGPEFSGSCIVTSRNRLLHEGATNLSWGLADSTDPDGEPAIYLICLSAGPFDSSSSASVAALGPPAEAKAEAMRPAPSFLPIASRTLLRRRSGRSREAGSRVPASATSTCLATSNWSRPNGTTHTGTPAASAFWVMPMPPWQTTQAARSRTARCG